MKRLLRDVTQDVTPIRLSALLDLFAPRKTVNLMLLLTENPRIN